MLRHAPKTNQPFSVFGLLPGRTQHTPSATQLALLAKKFNRTTNAKQIIPRHALGRLSLMQEVEPAIRMPASPATQAA